MAQTREERSSYYVVQASAVQIFGLRRRGVIGISPGQAGSRLAITMTPKKLPPRTGARVAWSAEEGGRREDPPVRLL